jgi:hypothetical protein
LQELNPEVESFTQTTFSVSNPILSVVKEQFLLKEECLDL